MIIIVLLFPMFLMSADSQTNDRNGDNASVNHTVTVEGVLRLYGNEPFTRVALVMDDEERYFLIMDNKEMARLWSERQGRVRISGMLIEKYHLGRPAKFIKVKKYKWVSD